jgi:putative membrane protein
MTGTKHREPSAFILDDDDAVKPTAGKASRQAHIAFEAESESNVTVVPPALPHRARHRVRWGAVLVSALAALFSLWAGYATTRLIEDMFAASPALGWLASVTAALAGFAALAIVTREIWGLFRLRRIEHLQISAARAINQDDAEAAQETLAALDQIYGGRADIAWSLSTFQSHRGDVMDGSDRVKLFDRLVISPLDEAAHKIIARRARRVTLLTTVTPIAALDIAFVAAMNLGMMRELAELYGGRPSILSTFRLARLVIGHLALTGGLALSDNVMQHVVGKGLLGRLSSRFGEGAVNGIMTSRIGLAAQEVCRPIPLPTGRKETLTSLLREVVSFGSSKAPAAGPPLET